MDVDLYVYDLSKGLARQLSLALTGTQIDAIYHTSLVFGGTEYFFGQGVHRTVPGTTHHGQPMQVIRQGRTELPMPVIEEYMESLAQVYTAESYDLFLHNCNNFTQDLSVFLVGKEIPEEIRTLPDRFLSTPFGQMMKPQIDAALRGVTQAPVNEKPPATSAATANHVQNPRPVTNGATVAPQQSMSNGSLFDTPKYPTGVVHNVSSLRQVNDLLDSAKSTCAVIFFTSATCAPCKIVYPAYDELAEEAGSKAVFVKVDINQAFDVAQKFGIRATPTFKTFSRGREDNSWSGASEAQLRGNVRMLLDTTYPPHPHTRLRLPNFQVNKQPVLYKKIPPMDKLAAKIGALSQSPPLSSLISFNKSRFASDAPAASTALPSDLASIPTFISEKLSTIPRESHFALVDLIRVSFIDPRVSGFFAAEDPNHILLLSLITPTAEALSAGNTVPYGLHLVTLQLLCNLFTSHIYHSSIFDQSSILHEHLLTITTTSLLSDNATIAHTAAALAFNLSTPLHNARFELQQQSPSSDPSTISTPDQLSPDSQVSLVASILEALQNFSSNQFSASTTTQPKDLLTALLLSLGLIIYGAPSESEALDLCHAMSAKDTISDISKSNKEYAAIAMLKDVVAML